MIRDQWLEAGKFRLMLKGIVVEEEERGKKGEWVTKQRLDWPLGSYDAQEMARRYGKNPAQKAMLVSELMGKAA